MTYTFVNTELRCYL